MSVHKGSPNLQVKLENEKDIFRSDYKLPGSPDVLPYRKIWDVAFYNNKAELVSLHEIAKSGPFVGVASAEKSEGVKDQFKNMHYKISLHPVLEYSLELPYGRQARIWITTETACYRIMSVSANYTSYWQPFYETVCFAGHVINILLNYRGPVMLVKLIVRISKLSGKSGEETYSLLRTNRKFIHDLLKDQNLSARIRKEYNGIQSNQATWDIDWEEHVRASEKKPEKKEKSKISSFFIPRSKDENNGDSANSSTSSINSSTVTNNSKTNFDETSSILSISEDESATYIEFPNETFEDSEKSAEITIQSHLSSSFTSARFLEWSLQENESLTRSNYRCPLCRITFKTDDKDCISAFCVHLKAHRADFDDEFVDERRLEDAFEIRFTNFRNDLQKCMTGKLSYAPMPLVFEKKFCNFSSEIVELPFKQYPVLESDEPMELPPRPVNPIKVIKFVTTATNLVAPPKPAPPVVAAVAPAAKKPRVKKPAAPKVAHPATATALTQPLTTSTPVQPGTTNAPTQPATISVSTQPTIIGAPFQPPPVGMLTATTSSIPMQSATNQPPKNLHSTTATQSTTVAPAKPVSSITPVQVVPAKPVPAINPAPVAHVKPVPAVNSAPVAHAKPVHAVNPVPVAHAKPAPAPVTAASTAPAASLPSKTLPSNNVHVVHTYPLSSQNPSGFAVNNLLNLISIPQTSAIPVRKPAPQATASAGQPTNSAPVTQKDPKSIIILDPEGPEKPVNIPQPTSAKRTSSAVPVPIEIVSSEDMVTPPAPSLNDLALTYSMDGKQLGCSHYKVNCKFYSECCGKWFTCRFCHDSSSDHKLDRHKTRFCFCMFCGTSQLSGSRCINSKCKALMAHYYCDKCKFWDNDSNKLIYHCDQCGICRAGLKSNYTHCDICRKCVSKSAFVGHNCGPKSPPNSSESASGSPKNLRVLLNVSRPNSPALDQPDKRPRLDTNAEPSKITSTAQSSQTPNGNQPKPSVYQTNYVNNLKNSLNYRLDKPNSSPTSLQKQHRNCWNCLNFLPDKADGSIQNKYCVHCSAIIE